MRVSRRSGRAPRRRLMKGNRVLTLALAVAIAVGIAAAGTRRAAAQDSGPGVKLWVDQSTGQVFVRPGRGRVPLSLSTANADAIEQQVEQKVEARTKEQIKQSAAQL